jgi:DNA-binding NarL/FixJ family response regulator
MRGCPNTGPTGTRTATWLTPREREVASFAASGLTNRAIAERLVLSVRTVDNHLQHAFDKLGIRNRRALGRLLGIDDATDPTIQ